MKNFFVISNKTKDPDYVFTLEIVNYLLKKGCKCDYQRHDEDLTNTAYKYTNPDNISQDIECVIVLGGDGTLLQAVRDLHKKEVSFYGINIGTLGFLTDIEMKDYKKGLDLIINDEFNFDDRIMLKGQIIRNNEIIYENIALNDITINRNGILRIIDFDVYVNEEYLNSYSADGVIVATATGSTAYSFSAGGPIVSPDSEIMVITPICPHTLNRSSIVIDANNQVKIIMSDNKKLAEERVASFDGATFYQLITDDKLIISKFDHKIRLLKTSKQSFFQVVRQKMNN